MASSTNIERAARITRALETYQATRGFFEDDLETLAVDFLADLLHWTAQYSLHFPELTTHAYVHYEEEAEVSTERRAAG